MIDPWNDEDEAKTEAKVGRRRLRVTCTARLVFKTPSAPGCHRLVG